MEQQFLDEDDESELIHFEAGHDTTTVPTTNQNVQQYATGGRENVDDSYVQATQIREEMESSPIKLEEGGRQYSYSPGERCQMMMDDEEESDGDG